MSSNFTQKHVDTRNFVFTVGVLVVIILFLTVFVEKMMGTIPPEASVKIHENMKKQAIVKTPVISRTTVKIQPLVTNFPPLPDFKSYREVDERKAAFIDYLAPIVEHQNGKILEDRNFLERVSKLIVNGSKLTRKETNRLKRLAEDYDVKWKKKDPGAVVLKLARRVDIIPLSLALVQAAKESSWGRSRYAVQANNLFGQWCFDAGCGVIPGNREPDAVHEVKKFKSVNSAVRSYIHNLNTHPRYKNLRLIRQQLRLNKKPVSGKPLADGLLYYSERRQAYVEEVKTMISQYHLFQERRTG